MAYQYAQNFDYVFSGSSNTLFEYNNSAIITGFFVGNRFDIAKGLITINIFLGGGIKSYIIDNAPPSSNTERKAGGIYQLNTKGFVPKGNIEVGFNF